MTERQAHIVIIAIACFLGLAARIYWLSHHFIHIDDLIPALTFDSTIRSYQEVSGTIIGKLKMLTRMLIAVPVSSTYAPFQYILTAPIYLLVSPETVHGKIIVTRSISIVFSVLTAVLWFKTLRGLLQADEFYNVFSLTFALLFLSVEGIIYSVQSSNYICSLAGTSLFVFLLTTQESGRSFWLTAVLLCITVLSGYQNIFLFPAYLLSIFPSGLNRFNLAAIVKGLIKSYIHTIPAVFLVLVEYRYLLRGKTNAGVHWNAGPQSEFLFNIGSLNFVDSVVYTVKFFIINLFHVIQSNFGLGEYGSIFNILLTLSLMILAIVGSSKTEIFKGQVIRWIALCALIWVVMVCFKLITLSPTRHSLALVALLLPLILNGYVHFIKKIKFKWLSLGIPALLIFVSAINFTSSNGSFKGRKSLLDESGILEIIRKEQPEQVIAFGWSYSLNLSKQPGSGPLLYNIPMTNRAFNVPFNSSKNSNKVLLLSESEVLEPRWLSYFKSNIQQLQTDTFKLQTIKALQTNAEVEYSPLTTNNPNCLYIYSLEF